MLLTANVGAKTGTGKEMKNLPENIRGIRNRSSAWRNEEEEKCNGISVKWCDGVSA